MNDIDLHITKPVVTPRALEQGQVDRPQTAAAAKTRLGDQHEVAA